MKTAILYRSFGGTTKQCAEWLHKGIESDIYKYSSINIQPLSTYDLIILCSPTYAGRIILQGYLQKKWDVLKDKEVILLVIGAAPAEANWSIRSYNKIPERIRESIKYFKVIGKTREDLNPVINYLRGIENTPTDKVKQ